MARTLRYSTHGCSNSIATSIIINLVECMVMMILPTTSESRSGCQLTRYKPRLIEVASQDFEGLSSVRAYRSDDACSRISLTALDHSLLCCHHEPYCPLDSSSYIYLPFSSPQLPSLLPLILQDSFSGPD